MKNFSALYFFELKKIGQQKLVPISVLLGGVLIIALIVMPLLGDGYYYIYRAENGTVDRISMPYSEVEEIRRSYLRTLSGQVLDEARMERLKENYADSDAGTVQWNLNPYSPFLYLNMKEDKSSASAEDFYQEQSSSFNAEAWYALTDGEQAYWKGKASNLEPFLLDYAGGWQAMVGNCGLLCLVTVLLVTVGLCRSFSEEHRYRTDQLALSSAKGKTTLFAARCAAGMSFAVGIALALFLLQIGVCGMLYGLDGFSTPLQLWTVGRSSALHLSIGQFTLVLGGLLLLAAAMTGAFVMLLSELFRTAVPAMIVPFLLSAATTLDLFTGNGRLIEQIVSYLPAYRISERTLEDYYLITIGGIQLNGIQFSFVLYLLLSGLFGALCWQCYRNYQVTGR